LEEVVSRLGRVKIEAGEAVAGVVGRAVIRVAVEGTGVGVVVLLMVVVKVVVVVIVVVVVGVVEVVVRLVVTGPTMNRVIPYVHTYP
jgi:hypothetical protein